MTACKPTFGGFRMITWFLLLILHVQWGQHFGFQTMNFPKCIMDIYLKNGGPKKDCASHCLASFGSKFPSMSTHGIHEDLLFLSGWRMLRKLKAWGFLAVPKYRLIMFLFFSYMSSTTTTSVVYPHPPQATPISAMSLEGFKLSIAILACYLGTIGKLHTSLSECLYCKKSHGMLNSRFYTDTFPRKQTAKKLKSLPGAGSK